MIKVVFESQDDGAIFSYKVNGLTSLVKVLLEDAQILMFDDSEHKVVEICLCDENEDQQ